MKTGSKNDSKCVFPSMKFLKLFRFLVRSPLINFMRTLKLFLLWIQSLHKIQREKSYCKTRNWFKNFQFRWRLSQKSCVRLAKTGQTTQWNFLFGVDNTATLECINWSVAVLSRLRDFIMQFDLFKSLLWYRIIF